MGNIFKAEQESLLNLAAAVEMLYTATRVHDDLGAESNQLGVQQTMNIRFLTSATILAGDLAFAAAAQLAASVESIAVMQRFSETLQFIVNGEITYLFNEGSQDGQEAYYEWIHAKIASVFELASEMAATIGSANPSEIDAAAQYGYNFGMAFQIMTEVLDFMGDPSVSGKPIGNDLHQGTITLPTLLYLQAHPADFDINAIRKRNGNGHAHIEDLIGAIRKSDAIHQAKNEADRFLRQAIGALHKLPDTPERAELAVLAKQVIHREPDLLIFQ